MIGAMHMRGFFPLPTMFFFLFAVVLLSLFPSTHALAQITSTTTYSNPLTPGADPFITFKDGYYYYLKTQGNAIDIWKTKSLIDLEHATAKRVFTAPASGPNSHEIWAPELHFLSNKWYIYYAADEGSDPTHRMYVLEGTSADPQGVYIDKGKIYDTANDTWAIDGTVFQHSDGKLYFVWSGRARNVQSDPQNIYIALMSNPWTISGRRVRISYPQYSWEKQGSSVNEGPSVLKRNGKTFITYSASFFNTPDYCLGMLTYTSGNILSSSSWKKSTSPVFQKTASVFGPGHNSFTVSSDGKEDFLIYHARNTTSTSEARTTRAQKFFWKSDGTPSFGTPVASGISLMLPSGDTPGDLLVDRFVLTDVNGVEKTAFVVGEAIYPKVMLSNQGGLAVETPTGSTYTHFYSNAAASVSAGTVSDVNVILKNGEFAALFSKEYGASPVGPNNSFFTANQAWVIPAVGTYTARVFVDFDASGIESTYANNQRTLIYTVSDSTGVTPTP